MEFTYFCPDGSMRANSVHLTCTTSLIISIQLHPMTKGKEWLLNFTEYNIKDSVEDKSQGSDPAHIFAFGTFYFIFPLVFSFAKPPSRVLSNIDLSWEVQHPCQDLGFGVAHLSHPPIQ